MQAAFGVSGSPWTVFKHRIPPPFFLQKIHKRPDFRADGTSCVIDSVERGRHGKSAVGEEFRQPSCCQIRVHREIGQAGDALPGQAEPFDRLATVGAEFRVGGVCLSVVAGDVPHVQHARLAITQAAVPFQFGRILRRTMLRQIIGRGDHFAVAVEQGAHAQGRIVQPPRADGDIDPAFNQVDAVSDEVSDTSTCG